MRPKGETLAEAEAYDRQMAIMMAAKAMGHEVCLMATDYNRMVTVCKTCSSHWTNDQHFNCPNFPGIVHK